MVAYTRSLILGDVCALVCQIAVQGLHACAVCLAAILQGKNSG